MTNMNAWEIAKEKARLWWSKSRQDPGTSEVYAAGWYAGYMFARDIATKPSGDEKEQPE